MLVSEPVSYGSSGHARCALIHYYKLYHAQPLWSIVIVRFGCESSLARSINYSPAYSDWLGDTVSLAQQYLNQDSSDWPCCKLTAGSGSSFQNTVQLFSLQYSALVLNNKPPTRKQSPIVENHDKSIRWFCAWLQKWQSGLQYYWILKLARYTWYMRIITHYTVHRVYAVSGLKRKTFMVMHK